MISDVLLKIAQEEYSETSNSKYRPRPSSAGPERCIRQTTYQALGFKKPPLTGRAVVTFDDSSWHEELTIDLMRRSAFHCHSEQMTTNVPDAFHWESGEFECPVCQETVKRSTAHGHIDWIATDILGVDRLIEHKALSHFGFQALIDGHMPLDYLTQMAFYMRGLQLVQPEITEGVLLVKNKNQSGYIELRVIYNSEIDQLTVFERTHHSGITESLNFVMAEVTESAINRFALVEAHRKNETLPARQYDYDHWRCQYCPYNEPCWSTWVDEQKALLNRKGQPLQDDPTLASDMIESLCAEDMKLREIEGDAKKQRKAIRESLRTALQAIGVRSGIAGDYTVNWSAKEKASIDQEKLPAEAVKHATVIKPSESLRIGRVKRES